MKINYIIATWSGIRHDLKENQPYYNDVLKNHVRTLVTTENNISQITIMKPRNPAENSDYYNIEPNDKIKIVDCENEYLSYGQWLKAAKLFLKEFDYFIFIEDDYVPCINNFDSRLIDIYKEGTYLCQLVDKNRAAEIHCALSNGLVSKQTITPLLLNHDYKEWFDRYTSKFPRVTAGEYRSYGGRNYQIVFSKYLIENGIILKDYTEFYNADYYKYNKIYNHFHQNVTGREKIFTPIQSIFKFV